MVRRGSKHFRIVNRDGNGVLASVSTTPSDHRTLDNLVSQLRKVGVLDIDPRKEGQVATPRDETLSPEQAALRERLLKVLQIIPPGDFSLHATELAAKRAAEDPAGVRAFKTSGDRPQKAAQWHLTQLVKHGQPIVGWAAANFEAALDDVMAVPVMAEAVEAMKEPEPDTRSNLEKAHAAKDQLRTLDQGLIERVNEIARAIESGLEIGRIETIKPRRWGYGLWPLLGRLVLETANRHGIDPRFSGKKAKRPRSPENAVGYRLRSLANGAHTYARTKRLAQLFVEDWDAGYRIRPDHLAGFRLLDPSHSIPAELRSTRSTRYAPDAVIEKRVPEQPGQVEPEPQKLPEIEDDAELGDVIEQMLLPEPIAIQSVTTTEVKHVYFPAAWEDGQMPLHLEMLRGAMELALGADPRINAIIETARRVMLAELGSH